jgi:3-oxoacyl-[acyl-carrier-protein] synthase II
VIADVAVTGIGVVSTLGVGVEAFWDALVAGRGARAPGASAGLPDARGARVEGLEPRRWVRSAQGRRIDRTSLLALAAARLALADAGLEPASLEPPRTALALGSAFGNVEETVTFLDRIFDRGTGNPLLFPNLVMNASLSYVTIELGINGPSAMVTEQEASGEAAIGWGARQVVDGAVDVCLAGAADELGTALPGLGRAARPSGAGATAGTNPSEGAAVLVLESPAHALRRGARRYARLEPHAGFGVPAPVHGWPADAGELARRLAPLAADVDLVVAAANGDAVLDGLEAEALARAFDGRPVAVTAPRGTTGSFGAAGALAVAAAALATSHGLVPPTIGWRAAAARGLDVVTGAARAMPVRRVLVDGLARGGTCRPLRLEAA